MMNTIPLLRIINSQGYGEAIVFKLAQAADILGMSYDEIVVESTEGRIYTKKFSNEKTQWRITVRAILEYVERAKIFTKDDDE